MICSKSSAVWVMKWIEMGENFTPNHDGHMSTFLHNSLSNTYCTLDEL